MALPSQRTKGSFWDSAVSDRTSEIGARSGPRSHPDADSSASPSPNHIGKALPNASLRHGRKTRLRRMDSTCGSRSRPFAMRIIRSATLLGGVRSEEHTSELQSLMRISYAVFCLKKKNEIINSNKKLRNMKNNNANK